MQAICARIRLDCSHFASAVRREGKLSLQRVHALRGFEGSQGIYILPESSIISDVTAGLSPSEYGASVSDALTKNSTSWILFNMATFYYRIIGHGNMAMQCARRALHFSPREHRDIAFLNMASLLFRGDYPRDALAMASMALDMSGETVPTYTLMGFMLASLSKFEESVNAFQHAMRLDEENPKLEDYKYAIKCHAKVHKGLSDQHKGLRDVIWQFERIASTAKKVEALMAAINDAKSSATKGLLAVLHFGNTRPLRSNHSFGQDGTYLFGFPSYAPILKWSSSVNLSVPVLGAKFSKVVIPEYEYHFLLAKWPVPEECTSHVVKDTLLYKHRGVVMPLENKGFAFWGVVGTLWAPRGVPLPHCEPYSFEVPAELKLAMVDVTQADDSVRCPDFDMEKVIFDYMLMCGSLDEFGRKLSLAFILGLLPPWMMYNMAAVYWRAVGAVTRAAECLTRAYYYVPSKFKDVVLLNMAGFFTFVNETESSLTMVKEAVDVTALEPATLYSMGNVLATHGFVSLAIKNYRLTLTQDISFYPAMEALRRLRCGGLNTASDPEKTLYAETLLESLGNGIVEIGFIDVRNGVQIVKRKFDSTAKSDLNESPEFSEKLRGVLSDLKDAQKGTKES